MGIELNKIYNESCFDTMALVDADIDTKLNEAIKLLTDKLTKYQITRLSDDLMLRWRIMEATK